MSIGPEDINKIAHLARLHIEDDKVDKISNDITNILSLVDQLQNADTDNVEPMAHPMDAIQVLRPDVVTEENKREKLQEAAPNTEDGLFLVPKVIE
jgi:aspartyl-tRNA(Asn)/glutamyl-tRNA(Gln) amidotransferase subunit C